jgi:hypothetical protein
MKTYILTGYKGNMQAKELYRSTYVQLVQKKRMELLKDSSYKGWVLELRTESGFKVKNKLKNIL